MIRTKLRGVSNCEIRIGVGRFALAIDDEEEGDTLENFGSICCWCTNGEDLGCGGLIQPRRRLSTSAPPPAPLFASPPRDETNVSGAVCGRKADGLRIRLLFLIRRSVVCRTL